MQVSLTSGHQFLKVLDTSPVKKRVDENKFMKIFRGFNWKWLKEIDFSDKVNNVNKYFDQLYSPLLEAAQRQALQFTASSKYHKKLRKTWMTSELLKLINNSTLLN